MKSGLPRRPRNEDTSSLSLMLKSTTDATPLSRVDSVSSHSSRFSMESFRRTQQKLNIMKEKAGIGISRQTLTTYGTDESFRRTQQKLNIMREKAGIGISRQTLTTYGTDLSGISYDTDDNGELIVLDERDNSNSYQDGISSFNGENEIIGDRVDAEQRKLANVVGEDAERKVASSNTKLVDEVLDDLDEKSIPEDKDEKGFTRKPEFSLDQDYNHDFELLWLDEEANIACADGDITALITSNSVEKESIKSKVDHSQNTKDSAEVARTKKKIIENEANKVKRSVDAQNKPSKRDVNPTRKKSDNVNEAKTKKVPRMKEKKLPAVMLRQTASSKLRDEEMQRKQTRLKALKSRKRPAMKVSNKPPDYGFQDPIRSPSKHIKKTRQRNKPTPRSKNKKASNITEGFMNKDGNRLKDSDTEKRNIHTNKNQKHDRRKGMSKKSGNKIQLKDRQKATALMKGSKLKDNSSRKSRDVHILAEEGQNGEGASNGDNVPEYVSDDNNDLISDISHSMRYGSCRRSVISTQLENGSWEEMYRLLVEMDHYPGEVFDKMLKSGSEAFHTTAWKSPPEIAKKFFDMLTPSHYNILTSTDADGNTPLHLCCANLESYDVKTLGGEQIVDLNILKVLLERAPQCLRIQNKENDSPLHLFLSSKLVSRFIQPGESLDAHAVEALELIMEKVLLLDLSDYYLLRDLSGATPLHVAIANEACKTILEYLINVAPAACKSEDTLGLTPLHYAAAFMQTPAVMVERIIEQYSYSVCHKTHYGDTPLHLLIRNSDDSELELNSNGVKVVNLIMGSTTTTIDEKYCPLLIQNREKLTPLHAFALFDDAPLCIGRELMRHAAAVKALRMINLYGSTPLHMCAATRSISIQRIQLLGRTDSTMAEDHLHRTPLHIAIQNENVSVEVVRALIELNPLSCEVESDGRYLPIHLAVHSKAKVDVLKELHRAHPPGIEQQNILGDTPLHRAVSNAPFDVIEFLLKEYSGAVYKQNQLGDLPLHCAVSNTTNKKIIQKLLQVWPQGVATPNKVGNSPLHCLLQNDGNAELVEQFINSAPSCILAENDDGKTPLLVAKEKGATEDVRRLLQNATNECKQQTLHESLTSFSSDSEIDLT